MVFSATNGTASAARSNARSVSARRSPASAARNTGPSRADRPDRDGDRFARRRDLELVAQAHRQKRRDEKRLVAGVPHGAAGPIRRHHIAVPPAESVVHLVDQRGERAVARKQK